MSDYLNARLAGDDKLSLLSTGIKPVKRDKRGDLYSAEQLNSYLVKAINTDNNFFLKRAKKMSNDIEQATDQVSKSMATFTNAYNQLLNQESKFSESVKKVSGAVRLSAESLSQGLAKIEKQANFDRLERYVDLLERAAKAMTILSEIEKNGKLEKIASALK